MPIGSIRLEERAQVELVDDVEHEPGQVVGRQPVTHIGWEQERLVTVTGTEVVGHGRSYATSLPCCLFRQPSRQPFSNRLLRVNSGALPDTTDSHPPPQHHRGQGLATACSLHRPAMDGFAGVSNW